MVAVLPLCKPLVSQTFLAADWKSGRNEARLAAIHGRRIVSPEDRMGCGAKREGCRWDRFIPAALARDFRFLFDVTSSPPTLHTQGSGDFGVVAVWGHRD